MSSGPHHNCFTFLNSQLTIKNIVQENGTKAAEEEDVEAKMAQMVCSLNNREECLACGS